MDHDNILNKENLCSINRWRRISHVVLSTTLLVIGTSVSPKGKVQKKKIEKKTNKC